MSRSTHALCPLCETPGVLGQPCSERGCVRHAVHFIPQGAARAALTAPPGDREPLIGQFIGPYLIISRLGRGGFGKVLLGLQRPLFRLQAAIKLLQLHDLNVSMGERILEKFENEASVLATLRHPNIVTLLQYGVFHQQPFLVMEYVRGRTLKTELFQATQRRARLPHDVIEHILLQVLNGVQAAHQQHVIHRDLKPDNIMLETIVGDPWFVKIVDFGLAKAISESNETSSALGTIVYMAPEQLETKNLGPWTDLYAIAAVAFELLTGRRAFTSSDTQTVIREKLTGHYDPFARLPSSSLHAHLIEFIRKGMARYPEDRFRSADEMREALRAAFATDAITRNPQPQPALPARPTPPSAPPLLAAPSPFPEERSPAHAPQHTLNQRVPSAPAPASPAAPSSPSVSPTPGHHVSGRGGFTAQVPTIPNAILALQSPSAPQRPRLSPASREAATLLSLEAVPALLSKLVPAPADPSPRHAQRSTLASIAQRARTPAILGIVALLTVALGIGVAWMLRASSSKSESQLNPGLSISHEKRTQSDSKGAALPASAGSADLPTSKPADTRGGRSASSGPSATGGQGATGAPRAGSDATSVEEVKRELSNEPDDQKNLSNKMKVESPSKGAVVAAPDPSALSSTPVLIRVSTTPSDAQVLLDGTLLGLTPLTVSGTSGSLINLKFQLNGWESEERSFTIAPNAAPLHVHLRRRATPPASHPPRDRPRPTEPPQLTPMHLDP